MRFRFLASLVIPFFATLCFADDANWVSVGTAQNFGDNRYVEMRSEKVEIQLTDEKMHVHATFEFRNHGPNTTVTMAFPDETSANNHATSDGKQAKYVMQNVWSTVDGQRAVLKRQKVESNSDFYVGSVWLKDVTFKRGQTRNVIVDYSAVNGFAGNHWTMNSYILRTGATWRGRISKCLIDVDWSKLRQHSRPDLRFLRDEGVHPVKWKRVRSRVYEADLRNIEPDFDLSLTMLDEFWNFTLNGKQVEQGHGISDFSDGVNGNPQDLRFPIAILVNFFGGYSRSDDGSDADYGILGDLHLVDDQTISINGRSYRLKRKALHFYPANYHSLEDEKKGEEPVYVYLKDVVTAISGSYRYDAADERVDVRVPVLNRPRKQHRKHRRH